MLENVPKSFYYDTANVYKGSSVSSPPFPPLSLPPTRSVSRDPETSTRAPEHFIFALSAIPCDALLKNYLMDFVV